MNFVSSNRPTYKAISLILATIAIGFLVFRAYQGIRELSESEFTVSFEFIGASIIFQFVGVCLAAGVWSSILKQMGVVSRYLFDLRVFCLSALGRKIPGGIWFAVGRIFLYERRGIAKSTVLMATFMELILNSIAGFIVVVFAIAIGDFRSPLTIMLDKSQGIALLLMGLILLISPFVFRRMLTLVSKRSKYIHTQELTNWRNWDVIRWVATNTLVTILGAGVLYSVGRSIPEFSELSFILVMGAWGLLVAVGPLAIWIPGEIGLKDGLMYLFLSPFMGGPPAALLILAWRVWVSIMEIIFGIICGSSLGLLHLRSIRIPGHD